MKEIKITFDSPFISDRLVQIMDYASSSKDDMVAVNNCCYIIERMGKVDNFYYAFTRTVWLNEELGYTWEDRGKFSVMRVIGGMIIKDDEWYYYLSSNGGGIDMDAYHGGAVFGLIRWYHQFITKKTLI